MKIIARRDALLLVLVVHLAIDVVLVSRGEIGNPPPIIPDLAMAYAMLVWPMSQGCLIAIWAANSRMRFWLRLPLSLAGTAVAWIVLTRMLEEMDAPEFALMLITQLAAILLIINAGRLVRRQFRLWRWGWTETDARATQFSLRQLLTWTAILAVLLGTGKAFFGWLGWTTDIFFEEGFRTLQLLAVYNVLYALLVFGLFTIRVRWPARIILFFLAVAACGALAWSMALILELLSGPAPLEIVVMATLIAAPQIVYLTMTLWPLWLCGYIGYRSRADGSREETTPASGSPFAS